MKKALALSLALCMCLSYAIAAFADGTLEIVIDNDTSVSPIYDNMYVYDTEDYEGMVDASVIYPDGEIPYGETVYYALRGIYINGDNTGESALVYESDAVDNLSTRYTWEMGEDLIESTEIVRRRIDTTNDGVFTMPTDCDQTIDDLAGSQRYAYFIAIELGESDDTGIDTVSATVEFRQSASSSTGRLQLTYDDNKAYIDFDVAYTRASDDLVVTDELQWFDAGVSFDDESDETEFVLVSDDVAYFTVDTIGQGDLLISASTDYDMDIALLYPEANLDFLKCNGAMFNKTGILTIYAEEGSYIYRINDDGTLSEIDAEYDDSDEAFLIRTRTLGSYVISDRELDVTESYPDDTDDTTSDSTTGGTVDVVEDGTTTTTPTNPSTGSRA